MTAKDDKVILAICDQSLSNSLSRVLKARGPLRLINIDPSNFFNLGALLDELEQFKDNPVLGIILTDLFMFNKQNPLYDTSGVELIKHIRLTKELGSLCCLPIVLLSSELMMHHLKAKRDNMLLISPKCYPIQVPFSINELFGITKDLKGFESPEEMKEEIKPFVAWSKEDDVISEHDNFNRYGPFKLLKEHFETLPYNLSKDYNEMTNKLWFKKHKFLRPQQPITTSKEEFNEEDFKKIISGKKFLYIDDEHRLGWSYALYSIISNHTDRDTYSLFQQSAGRINTPGEILVCIDNFTEAFELFRLYQGRLDAELSAFSEAEHNKNLLQKEFNTVSQDFQKTKRECERVEKELSGYKTNIESLMKLGEEIQQKLRKNMEDFAIEYTGKQDFTILHGLITKMEELRSEHSSKSNMLKDYITKSENLDAKLKTLQSNRVSMQNSFTESQSKESSARRHFNDICARLVPFEFDLVLLDLRLEKEKDYEVSASEISGIKLLKHIKESDPSVPVIVLTASEKTLNYREAINFGASGYWIKAVNSASALKSEIIKALDTDKDIRNLWLGIKKVETKKQLIYFYEAPSDTQNLARDIMKPTSKSNIISLLKESFLLFQRELSPYEKSVCNYTNYGKIALNMGLIQEERLYKIKGERYAYWKNKGEIPPDEINIKNIRNKVAHEAKTKISYKEALEVFQKTIERCLIY